MLTWLAIGGRPGGCPLSLFKAMEDKKPTYYVEVFKYALVVGAGLVSGVVVLLLVYSAVMFVIDGPVKKP